MLMAPVGSVQLPFYDDAVRLAMDEQIFALQAYGGISRDFVEQIRVLRRDSSLGVDLLPIRAPIINEFILQDPHLTERLEVRAVPGAYRALAHYVSRRRRRESVDVVHNTFYLPRGLADYPGAKRVSTVHDMIPELLPRSRRRLDFLTRKAAYVRASDHIICVSNSTRRDLLRAYPEIKVPVSVAYPGVSQDFSPQAPKLASLPDPYLLHVGNRSGYKDTKTLLLAFFQILTKFPDLSLVLVGGGQLTTSEQAMIRQSRIEPTRIQQISLPDRLIPSAYAHARVTIFPSQYEGFGLPAVEAMACGSPLILANTSSLPEVGDTAALYFQPGAHGELADLLTNVLTDESQRKEMASRGVARARSFTWEAYTLSNVEVYRRLLN